jgi:membrane associated rhomboid family serine protease
LSVVCRSCGSEVSPYVTECPYCGTRIRKRAPKLERHGDELQARESRGDRRRRARAKRVSRASERLGERPYATIAAIVLPAVAVLVMRAGDFPVFDLGALVGPVEGGWWHYLAAPWIYPDVGYLFVVAVAIAIFGTAVERRIGTAATVVLMIACGSLGMLAADGIETALGGEEDLLLASGGNGVALGLLAAWWLMQAAEMKRPESGEQADVIGAAVCAVVLIMLPLVEDFANVFAALGGALVGAACGFVTARARRSRPSA